MNASRHGVWWVELAALSDPLLVPQAVTTVLDVREQPDRLLAVSLQHHLRAKELILVLDNCEHVTDACAELAHGLLRTCPGVRILATSELLGDSEECVWAVPALSYPDLAICHRSQSCPLTMRSVFLSSVRPPPIRLSS